MNCDKILKEKWTSFLRGNYVTVDGYTMTDRYEELKKEIDNMEVSDKDVWVCSFPKSGTTWTQEMVWMIFNHLDYEGAKESLNDRSPFLELCAIMDYRSLMKSYPEITLPKSRLDSINFIKSQAGPKVIKTHLPWELLPSQIKNGVKKPKIIYVARNPKDVCVSYHHHSKLLTGYKGTFEEFCELFLADKILYAPYWNHVMSYWSMKHLPNILFLKYEDMKKDLSKTIQKVSEFLERPMNDEQVEKLTEHLSFEKMKQNPAVNKEDISEFYHKYKISESDGKFFRSGKVGDHKELMSKEMVGRFDKWIKSNVDKSDYTI